MDSRSTPPPGQEPQDAAYMPTVSGPAVPPYPGDMMPPSPLWPAVPTPGPTPAPSPGPAGRPRRRRGRAVALAAAVVVGLAAGTTTAVLLLRPTPETPAAMALEAGRAVAPAAGLDLTGTIDGNSAKATVTRAGTVEGSYVQDAAQVSRVTIGGVTYLKAPASFWTLEDGPDAARQAGGHWAKAPADLVPMSYAALTPGQISRVLEHAGQHPRVTDGTFGGRQVIRLTAGGATYYITSSIPNRLLHVEGTSGAARYSFDVTPLSAAAIGPVFTVLHADVRQMQGAPEPDATVNPLQKIQFHNNCNGSTSCTVSMKVSVSDPESAEVILTLTVAFSGTENGRSFATCTDTVRAATAQAATATPSCGLGRPVWPRWINSHTSDFSTWATATFKVTVNTAGDIAALHNELTAEQGS